MAKANGFLARELLSQVYLPRVWAVGCNHPHRESESYRGGQDIEKRCLVPVETAKVPGCPPVIDQREQESANPQRMRQMPEDSMSGFEKPAKSVEQVTQAYR